MLDFHFRLRDKSGMAKTPKDTRKGSRHKPRVQVGLPADLYAALAALAERNDRPINRECAIHIRKAVEEAGFWPPPAESK